MWIQKIKCKEEKIRDSNHVEDNLELMLDWMLWSCSSYLTPGHEGGDQVRSSWDNWSCSSPDVFHLQAAALSHCGRVRPAPGPTWWRRPLPSRGGRQLRRRAQAEVQGEVETPSALCTEVTASTTADLGHVMVPSLFRERKPKVYASYAICECCVQEQEMDRRTSSYRSQEMDRRGATSYRRYRDSQASLNDRSERAASAPPQTTGSPKKHGTNQWEYSK